MKGLLRISSAVDFVSARFGELANWFVLAAVLISAVNATVRYVFSYSSNAFLEIQWYLFGAVVLLGAAHTLCKNEHVRVDLVYSSVSHRGRLWIDVFGLSFFLIPVGCYLTKLSVPFFLASFENGEISNNAGGLILWPVKLMLPLGFVLITAQGISELIKRISALAGLSDAAIDYERPLQ